MVKSATIQRSIHLRSALLGLLVLVLPGCALWQPPADIPPPWDAKSSGTVQTAPAPTAHTVTAAPITVANRHLPPLKRIGSDAAVTVAPPTRMRDRPMPAFEPAPEQMDAEPHRPAIYLAPDPPSSRSQPPAANSPQVLQAEPGPALSLDFTPNPAWRRAEIPAGSRAATVGRVPPAAASAGFTIGAGDTVQIDVLGRAELSAKGNVSSDGRVNVALVGPINIGGLTPVQAAERIAAAYRQGQYLVSPQVTVTMIDYQSQLLTVLGEVRNPGRFPMRTRLSVLDGLALAGGINEQGASMAYLLRPEDSVVTRYEIDLDALIQAGAGQQYFEMLAGDTLVVPKTQVFYIYGEAKNPNAYKLKPGMTVIQALSLAGGLTDRGSDRRIDIRRRDGNGRLRTLAASLNEPLQPDDVVYIRERLF